MVAGKGDAPGLPVMTAVGPSAQPWALKQPSEDNVSHFHQWGRHRRERGG